jgi:putative glycosyltransferase
MNRELPRPSLSIVSTMFRSAGYLEEFCSRVAEAADQLEGPWEMILVNDGSPDESLKKAISMQNTLPQIIVVDLSKNFGHHFAIIAGLSQARGEHVFLIDCDLEENPEWLIPFQSKMTESGADVVYGQQLTRKGKWFEDISGQLFYSIFNLLSNSKMPESWVTARLMTRQYVDAVLNYGERALFLGGTFTLAGFNQVPVLIKKTSRETSTYSLKKRFILFVNAVTSFSPQPLYFIFAIGLTVTVLSFLGFLFVLVRALFGYTFIGWASLISSIWLFGGLTIFSIGLVGVYVGKILIESKQRPLYHIKRIYTAYSNTSNS